MQARTLTLVFDCGDSKGPLSVLFCSERDVRRDMCVSDMLQCLECVWRRNALRMGAVSCNTLATSTTSGLIEQWTGGRCIARLLADTSLPRDNSALLRCVTRCAQQTRTPLSKVVSRFARSLAVWAVVT
jgi:hypothetical protein